MPGARVATSVWISEYISPYDQYLHGVKRILVSARTEFQEMLIVETGVYGKALVLDGLWQSCTGEEFIYHEPLVHVGCVTHGGPRRVLVLGGGEGATIREALKWNTVAQCTMVDIDGAVVEACREHLPEMHQGAFDDPRTELVIGDALEYLDDSPAQWDLVISDLSDPIEEGPSFALFTKEYFEKVYRVLSDGGVFVLQAGPVSPPEVHRHAKLNRTVAAVFGHAVSFATMTATYGSPWGFVIARKGEPVDDRPSPEDVDALLATRTSGHFRMFDGKAMLGLLCTPKHIRDEIAKGQGVYTQAEPPKFFGSGAQGE